MRLRVISTRPSSEMSNTWVRVLSRARASRNTSTTFVAVVADLHVDEVDDDDAADVAQAQLLGDLLGRLEVVVEHRLLEARRADVLAGVDVDHRQRLGVLDDQRAARRQPHLAVERLVHLLVHVVALEQAEPFGRGVVVLDAVGQLGVERRDVVLDLLVEAAVVDDDAAVLGVELLADHPHGQVGLAVQQRRRLGLGRLGGDLLPLRRAAGVMSARSSSSVACSAAVRTIRPCSAGFTRSRMRPQALAHVVGQALGDAVGLGVGDQHHEAAGQRRPPG